MSEKLSGYDFLIPSISVLVTAVVALWHGCRPEQSSAYFLTADRRMGVFPVAFSLLTCFISSFSVLGVPAEVYRRGLLIWIFQLMAIPAMLLFVFAYLPFIHRQDAVSMFKIFQTQLDSRGLGQFAAFISICNTLFYISEVVYGPTIALSGVTGLDHWIPIFPMGVVCVLYTALGGLKGVIWTGALQTVIMFLGMLFIVVAGSMGHGEMIWNAFISRTTPLKSVDIDGSNPFQYFSLWIAIFGGFGFYFSLYGSNQVAVQRFCSLRTLSQSRKAVALMGFCYFILLSMCSYLGVVMAVDFDASVGGLSNATNCTQYPDQLMIYFILGHQHPKEDDVLVGLYLAVLCSATLTTLSSGIHAMATITWEDFLKDRDSTKDLPDSTVILINQLLAFLYGFAVIGLAALASSPGGGLIKVATSRISVLGGPFVGLFIVTIGIRGWHATKFAAFASTIIGLVFCTFLMVVSILIPHSPVENNSVYAFSPNKSVVCRVNEIVNEKSRMLQYFLISDYLFTVFGILIVVILAVVISLVQTLYRNYRNRDSDNNDETELRCMESMASSEVGQL